MEFIIMYIVAAILLCLLTGSAFFLSFAILTVFIGFVAVISVYFLLCVYKLFHTSVKKGSFVRVDEVKQGSAVLGKSLKYKVAVYEIDGKEYESVFPAEGLFGVYFYSKTQSCRLWLYEKEKRVFDTYNIASCVVWPIFCALFMTAAVFALMHIFKMRYMM